jgi:enterochelin esterase family protein
MGPGAADVIAPATDRKAIDPPIEDVIEPVFRRLRAEEMIVVIPDGKTRYGCSQWVDSPVHGNFAQYVIDEVVPYVDRRFRTIPSRDSRGVFGYSSGGFGAWHLGSRHPDVFGALAVLSGDSAFDISHKPFLYRYYLSIYPDQPSGYVEGNFWSLIAYSCAASYSPNPDNAPHYVDLPVVYPTGELVQPIWDKWLRYDMVVNWSERAENLRRLRGILLDVGRNDEYSLQWGHRMTSHGLTTAGIAHQSTEHNGDHISRIFERHQHGLKWLAEVLDHHG